MICNVLVRRWACFVVVWGVGVGCVHGEVLGGEMGEARDLYEAIHGVIRPGFVETEFESALLHKHLGMVYAKQGRSVEALYYLLFALAVYEQGGDTMVQRAEMFDLYYYIAAMCADLEYRAGPYLRVVQGMRDVLAKHGVDDIARATGLSRTGDDVGEMTVDRMVERLDTLPTEPVVVVSSRLWGVLRHELPVMFWGEHYHSHFKKLVSLVVYFVGLGMVLKLGYSAMKRPNGWYSLGILMGLVGMLLGGLGIQSTKRKITFTQDGIKIAKPFSFSLFMSSMVWFVGPELYHTVAYRDVVKCLVKNGYRVRTRHEDSVANAYPVYEDWLELHAVVDGKLRVYVIEHDDRWASTKHGDNAVDKNFFFILNLLLAKQVPVEVVVKDLRPVLRERGFDR